MGNYKYYLSFYNVIMVRVRNEIAHNIKKNPVFSKILFELAIQPDNSVTLSKRLNKSQSIVFRQLTKLKGDHFVIASDNKKNALKVNWEHINACFFDHLKKKKPNEKIKKNMLRNPYLQYCFMFFFKKYGQKKVYITLEQLFDNLRWSLLSHLIGAKNDTEEKKYFIEFLEKLSNYLYNDDIFEDFLHELGVDLTKMMGGKQFKDFKRDTKIVPIPSEINLKKILNDTN